MRKLSKSRLLAYRQCSKRLWLEVHQPELKNDSVASLSRFETGSEVGQKARELYDPEGKGRVFDPTTEGFDAVVNQTRGLLSISRPIFEGGFSEMGTLVFADVLLPIVNDSILSWRIIEVKSSTSIKPYHLDDAAVQAYVAETAGARIDSVAVAHVNKDWVYQGDGGFNGFFVEADVTNSVRAKFYDVERWIREASEILKSPSPPMKSIGAHCKAPFECGFYDHCSSSVKKAEYPVSWLPGKLKAELADKMSDLNALDMREVSEGLLSEKQRRVRGATITGQAFFDRAEAQKTLAQYTLPAYFLDFETISLAVPRWSGVRPYQAIPFQFSVHCLSSPSSLHHHAFLDLSGSDPSEKLIEALIAACGTAGPVYVYSSFEKTCISQLATRFPLNAITLNKLIDRLVDLLPVAKAHYYHPAQRGSWSIKNVLPSLFPELDYTALEGVSDGGMAMEAYVEATTPAVSEERKAELRAQLEFYCHRDTYALVKVWSEFAGVAVGFPNAHQAQ
jgi:predicted RecB family nuclease